MRSREDDGAVAVLVALLSVVLFGFGALVVDVGALYHERRQLQNGSDAAALAVAQSCAVGDCGSYVSTADTYADVNALDRAALVAAGDVCGSAGLPACSNPPSGLPGSGYVRVTTRTEEKDGSLLVPPFLARVLVPGYTGTEVNATATVVWGAAGGVHAELAITFSQCEYDRLTKVDGQTVYAEEPYAEHPELERVVYFHDTTEAGSCPAGPSGADLPGGFGWLDSSGACTATVTNGWAGADPGASSSKECKAALEALAGQTLLIPIYTQTNDLSGTNGQYQISSYVGFVLTGWNFPGTSLPSPYRSGPGNKNPCLNSQTCLSGFFVRALSSGGPVSNGPDQGVRVVQLVS